MKKKLLALLLFIFCISSQEIIAQEATDYEKEIDKVIKPFKDFHIFNGTILVAKNGKIIYEKGIGQANMEWQVDNKPNVKFVIGSMSKSLTATLILKMVEDGKLTLQDTITKYLQNYPQEKGSKITIHHLLSNTSGIPNYFRLSGWTTGEFRKDISRDEFIAEIAKFDLQFEPGKDYLYSNSGYYLLAAIVENILGKEFDDIMDTYIFNPLNMENSGIYYNQNLTDKIASGYRFSSDGGYKNQPFFNMKLFNAAGNVFSTTLDLFKWEQALYANEFLSQESKLKLFNPENNYGWRNELLKIDGIKNEIPVLNYDGQIEGYSSMITRFIDDKSTIIILGNTGISYFAKQKLTNDIAAILYNLPTQTEKIPLSFVLTKAQFEGDLDKGITLYKSNEELYSTNEQLINDIGQQLSWSGQSNKAIKIFELNASIFPDSPTANFQIAEEYKEQNELQKAIPYYQKTLKYYPSNQYIKNILADFEE